ncbi:hypothetical protein JAAARDRAFT_35767 [Jaapia argillacea MUCL 33604]|uniref:Uncharacterized protein n=1 Tax=Jaapia argillacea MUCL 33604 TaxID=933084 RepID=A0A067Q101_9AGAM|nr:hypothetical protein JAAARDRAFT_35767 [Jaapia argillacea MUCL 33604]
MLVGIALHRQDEKGLEKGYHWCLVIHPESYTASLTRTYEMVTRDERPQRTVTRQTRFARQPLSLSPNLIGVVHIGQVNVGEHHMDEFLRGFGPERDDYSTGGRGWTSAGWVTRCLRYLDMSELLRVRLTDEELYLRVTKLGGVIEEMKSRGQGIPVSVVHL